jgi:2-phospho-L-lactate guanylyltransferase (CobY/MobA/RfbA family)
MKDTRFVICENVVPLVAPQDIIAVATPTPFISLKNALHATVFLFFGSITAASADQAITVTLEVATAAASGSEAAIAFNYRLSGAVGSNTWGAITAATTAGVSVATTDDNKILAIDVDPRALESALADASHIRAVVTPNAGGTATLLASWVVLEPRYAQLTHKSAT